MRLCNSSIFTSLIDKGFIERKGVKWKYTDKSLNNKDSFKKKLKNIHPVGRAGEPEDVANLICWLVSEEASFVTGQVWTMDGGRMIKLSLPDN